jgi:hypothetical protein
MSYMLALDNSVIILWDVLELTSSYAYNHAGSYKITNWRAQRNEIPQFCQMLVEAGLHPQASLFIEIEHEILQFCKLYLWLPVAWQYI